MPCPGGENNKDFVGHTVANITVCQDRQALEIDRVGANPARDHSDAEGAETVRDEGSLRSLVVACREVLNICDGC